MKSADTNFAAIPGRKFGWGGRIRTFTVLINSEVSYRLDHAPAVRAPLRGMFREKTHPDRAKRIDLAAWCGEGCF